MSTGPDEAKQGRGLSDADGLIEVLRSAPAVDVGTATLAKVLIGS